MKKAMFSVRKGGIAFLLFLVSFSNFGLLSPVGVRAAEVSISTVDEPAASEQSAPADSTVTTGTGDFAAGSSGSVSSLTTSGTPPDHLSHIYATREPANFTVGGGKAEIQESTGAFSYSYPLDIPKGRAGLQPDLALSYNSQAGSKDSIYGYGWDLSIPSVIRSGRTGVDTLYTDPRFILNMGGVGELVPVTVDANGYGDYGAQLESGFYKIEYLVSGEWKVTDKLGTVYTFGATTLERQDDPSDGTRIYKWMLAEIRDTNDNFVRFEYFKDSGQIYPSKILYTGHGAADGIFEIRFEPFATGTPSERPDKLVSYAAGFAVTTKYRVSRISTSVNGAANKFYELQFETGTNNNRTLLNRVRSGSVGAGGLEQFLPDTTFTYETVDSTWEEDISYTIPIVFEQFLDNYTTDGNLTMKLQILDVNGDGLQDILRSFTYCGNLTRETHINNGQNGWDLSTGYYEPPFRFHALCDNASYEVYKTFRVLDVNGDTLPDFMQSYFVNATNTSVRKVYINNGVNGWDFDPAWTTPLYFAEIQSELEPYPTNDRTVRFEIADVNGDGRSDFIESYVHPSGQWIQNVYLNNGVNGWDIAPQYTLIPLLFAVYRSSPLSLEDDRRPDVRIFDVNGDGLADMVRSRFVESANRTDKEVYLNNGKTGWELVTGWNIPFIFTYLSPVVGRIDYGARFKIVDINSDGLEDLVYAWNLQRFPQEDIREVYLNNGVDGWYLASNWNIPFYFAETATDLIQHDFNPRVRLFDVQGSGIIEYVESSYFNNSNTFRKKVYRTSSIQATDRLKQIDVNDQPTVSVSYGTSALERDGVGAIVNPKLPINALVAKTITYHDNLGGEITKNFQYSGGSFYTDAADLSKNRFAGFGKVAEVTGDTKKVSYFHQGGGLDGTALGEYQDDFYKIGRPYRTEVYDVSSGSLKQQQLTKWDEHVIAAGRSFVFSDASSATTFGSGNIDSTASQFDYDFATGNLLQEHKLGQVTIDQNTGVILDILLGDERTVVTDYAANAAKHITAAPKSGTISDTSDSRLQKVYYDTLPLGQVDKVNPTKEEFSVAAIAVNRTFNAHGLADTETDPRNNMTDITYDTPVMYPDTITNPLTQVTDTTYNLANGQIAEKTDPNTAREVTTFDDFGRATKKQVSNPAAPAALVTVQDIAYNDTALPRFIETKDHFSASQYRTSREYFDGLGRSIQKKSQMATAGEWSTADTTYDVHGRVNRTSLPYVTNSNAYSSPDLSKPATTFTYDALDRVLTETNLLGTMTYSYDGFTVTITDPQSRVKDITYDAYGNVKEVKEHKSISTYTTSYEYNVSNKLKKITDSANNERNFVYNDLDRLTSQDMVHRSGTTGAVESYTSYDNNGNLLAKTTFKGDAVTYTYDALNRVTTEKLNGITKITYTYDQGTYGIGHLTNVAYDTGDSVTYTYDILGRKLSETHSIKGLAYTTSFEYDLTGALSKVTYPDGAIVEYSFDSAGQVSQIQINKGAGLEPLVSNIQYNANGQLTHLERANGVTTDYTYDPQKLYRLTNLHTAGTSGDLQNISYLYQPVGNITDIVDTAPTPLQKTATYGYDDLNRLTSAAVTYANTPASNYSVTYDYDAIGNMTVDSLGGARTYGSATHPHQLTQVGATAITYDNAGNVLNDGQNVYAWDQRNRMASSDPAANDDTTFYRYGYDNQRYLKFTTHTPPPPGGGGGGCGAHCPVDDTGGGQAFNTKGRKITIASAPTDTITSETRYPGFYHEVQVGVAVKDYLFLNNQRVATLNNGNTLFFTIGDHLGSSDIVTDNAGLATEYRDYRPYGTQALSQVTTDSKNTRTFTDKERDTESNLQYYGARYLSNGLARFSSVDPVMFYLTNEQELSARVGRKLAQLAIDPQQLNSYSYAGNNPLKNIDYDGQILDTIVDIGFIAYDLFKIGQDYMQTGSARQENVNALGLDVGGAFLPFATGFGLTSRVAGKADNILRHSGNVTNLVNKSLDLKKLDRAVTAESKLQNVSNIKRVSVDEILDKASVSQFKYRDYANNGNINILIKDLTTESGYARVTLNPEANKIISSGFIKDKSVLRYIETGRFELINK